jgi:hypothetical protein
MALQLLADTKIEAKFPKAYKTLILLEASLLSSFFNAELQQRHLRFPLVKRKMHDHTA